MLGMFQKIQTNSVSFFLYIIGLGFAGVVGYQIVAGKPVNEIALNFVYVVVAFAINAQGVKSGVEHTNDTVSKVSIAQYPLTPAGIAAKAETDAEAAQLKDAAQH